MEGVGGGGGGGERERLDRYIYIERERLDRGKARQGKERKREKEKKRKRGKEEKRKRGKEEKGEKRKREKEKKRKREKEEKRNRGKEKKGKREKEKRTCSLLVSAPSSTRPGGVQYTTRTRRLPRPSLTTPSARCQPKHGSLLQASSLGRQAMSAGMTGPLPLPLPPPRLPRLRRPLLEEEAR